MNLSANMPENFRKANILSRGTHTHVATLSISLWHNEVGV